MRCSRKGSKLNLCTQGRCVSWSRNFVAEEQFAVRAGTLVGAYNVFEQDAAL